MAYRQSPFLKRKRKEGKHISKRKTVSLDFLLFPPRQRQSSPMRSGMLDSSLAFYLSDRGKHWRNTKSSSSFPLRSWLSSAAPRKQTQRLPPVSCRSPYSPIPFLQALNSLLQRLTPQHHKFTEWLILSDPLLAAFFIFMAELTSLWDR